MKKKVVAAVLCFCFVVSSLPSVFSLAAKALSPQAHLTLTHPEEITIGEVFTVTILAETEDAGASFGAWILSVTYDPTVLSYLSGADSGGNGTLLFCDSVDQGTSSLRIEVKMQAIKAGDTAIGFGKVQLVDFDSVQPFSVTLPEGTLTVCSDDPLGKGDLDGDGATDSDDAVYLLFHTLFPERYPIEKPCDFDGSGDIDSDDAVYLLFFTLFPSRYPL